MEFMIGLFVVVVFDDFDDILWVVLWVLVVYFDGFDVFD